MPFRHQLAAYSPLSATACARGGAAALGIGADPRRELRDLLLTDYEATSAVLCGSGTQALQIAIGVATRVIYGNAANPLVAMPAFSCFDIASSAIGAAVTVSLYDVDPRTLGPNLGSFERVVAAGAKVVVVAPLYGVPVDWAALETIASRYGALLIEDAAQGHGASWRGRKLGTIGRLSTLSFGRGKGWTGGSGGAVLSRGDPALPLPSLASPGRGREAKTVVGLAAQWTLGRPEVYGIPRSIPALHLGETTYHAPSPPQGMTRAAAAAVLANRLSSDAEAVERHEKAAAILSAMSSRSDLVPVVVGSDAVPGYLRLPVRVQRTGTRELEASVRASGVERSYPIPLSELPEFSASLRCIETEWPGARTLVDELVTIPTHSRVALRELETFLAGRDA